MYKRLMRFYQWVITHDRRFGLDKLLVWQLNRMQRKHRPRWVAEHARRQAERRAAALDKRAQ
jgi:hypothetical protein